MFFGIATPILPVSSLEASMAYYSQVLGFNVDWLDPGVIASVSREKTCLFLIQGDQGHPGTWVWIGVGDVEELHAEYCGRGARIRHPPTNYYWAFEMQVEDLDGNVLRMGSDSRPGMPFGPWLDMRGNTWVDHPDGGWTVTGPEGTSRRVRRT